MLKCIRSTTTWLARLAAWMIQGIYSGCGGCWRATKTSQTARGVIVKHGLLGILKRCRLGTEDFLLDTVGQTTDEGNHGILVIHGRQLESEGLEVVDVGVVVVLILMELADKRSEMKTFVRKAKTFEKDIFEFSIW